MEINEMIFLIDRGRRLPTPFMTIQNPARVIKLALGCVTKFN